MIVLVSAKIYKRGKFERDGGYITAYTCYAKTQYRKFETNIPRKKLRGHSPNIHIQVSMRDLYIPRIGLSILLQENIWTYPGIYI